MPDLIYAIYTISLVNCGFACTQTIDCMCINYHRQSRTCELSSNSGHSNAVTRITDTGWNIYIFPYVCPNSVRGFTRVGSMTVKICQTQLNHSEATAACSQFGGLVKLDTGDTMTALRDHLNQLEQAASFSDFWVDGHRDDPMVDTTWYFHDGTPMPPITNTLFWHSSQEEYFSCLRIGKPLNNYRMSDKSCKRDFDYICEMY